MRECLTCQTSKPDPCYQSVRSAICVACTGRFARKETLRRQGVQQAREVREAERLQRKEDAAGRWVYTNIPVDDLSKWAKEMQALVPVLWETI